MPFKVLSQGITFKQASESDNPKTVATFIKNNPNHPKVGELKQKLISLVNNGKASAPKTPEKPSTNTSNSTKPKPSTTKPTTKPTESSETLKKTPPLFSKFKKFKVGNTVMEIYFPEAPEWEKSVSDDKSDIYTTAVNFADIDYGAVVIRFSPDTMKSITDPVNVLENYMFYLEDSTLKLYEKTNIRQNLELKNQPKVKGFQGFGKTMDGIEFKIKGWTDGKYIAVLFMSSQKEMIPELQEFFLNGVQFPQ
jgi:hypothetical protein